MVVNFMDKKGESLFKFINPVRKHTQETPSGQWKPETEQPSVAFGCVVDNLDKFRYQAARLLLSLRWNGGRLANAPFYVVSTAYMPKTICDFFQRHGATIHVRAPFDEINPGNTHIPSNKLRLFEVPELEKHEYVVLIDCDTIIVQDPFDYLIVEGIGAKLADLPTVKDEQLLNVLDILGINKKPSAKYKYELVEAETIGYFNSGVISFSRQWLKPFTERWAQHSRSLLKLSGNMPFTEFHVNQAALAATVIDLEPPITELPLHMNFPVHLNRQHYPEHYDQIDPIIIHYHQRTDQNGLIEKLPLKRAWQRAIEFNEKIESNLKEKREFDQVQTTRKPAQKGNGDSPKVVVGSGWWSDEKPHDWAKGDELTTNVRFFSLWYQMVRKYLNPDAIVVTDSHSPIKPNWQDFENITWIELDKNYGHPNDIRVGKIQTKYSGFTRSVINGAMFALCCDADYYVYLEQDCLISGDNFLDHAIGDSDADVFLGDRTRGGRGIEGKPAAPMFQQSCIIVKKAALERFISGTMSGQETDGQLSPEVKMARDIEPWGILQVPYGRSRPIDFSQTHFYAQHLQNDELMQFLDREGIDQNILLDRSSRLYNL